MKRTVRVLRPAERDLQQIYETAVHEYGARADELFDRLLQRIASLDLFAERGSRPRDPALAERGFRFVLEEPHLVFYRVRKAQVRVHRVLHGHRRYRHLL